MLWGKQRANEGRGASKLSPAGPLSSPPLAQTGPWVPFIPPAQVSQFQAPFSVPQWISNTTPYTSRALKTSAWGIIYFNTIKLTQLFFV